MHRPTGGSDPGGQAPSRAGLSGPLLIAEHDLAAFETRQRFYDIWDTGASVGDSGLVHSMIITRTPFRISFAGGGSDIAAFYRQEPGVVLSTAIDKYMYISVMPRFGGTFRISYSRTELRDTIGEIEHPVVRECLGSIGLRDGLEIVSMAELPAEAGMGSSSSFTVGLLHALHAYHGHVATAKYLAAEACRVEIEKLGEPID